MGRAAGETHRPRGVDRAMMGFASLYPSYAAPAQATGLASHPGGAVCNNACDRKPRARRMSRYLLYVACLALTLFSAWMLLRSPHWYWPLGIFGALSLLGTWDMLQTRTTLRRNYPILAHLRSLYGKRTRLNSSPTG